MKKIISIFVFALTTFCTINSHSLSVSENNVRKQQISDSSGTKSSVYKEEQRPVLTVTPREIDLGAIKPGETVSGDFILKNIANGLMEWSASCPDDWETINVKTLKGTTSNEPTIMHLEITVNEGNENFKTDKTRVQSYRTSMKLEASGKEIICHKDLKAGTYRKAIKMTSAGGQRTIFVDFRIHASQEIPSINLNPQRLDLGVQQPGRIISKRIALTNRGREMLKWSVIPPQSVSPDPLKGLQKERYFSFHNDEFSEPGKYVVPEHLKDSLELIGKWTEKNGYPFSKGTASAIKFKFYGTGISLFLQSHSENGNCSVYLDENLLNFPDVLSGEWEKKELLIGEGLPDSQHIVTFVIREGALEVEGVKVFGRDILRGPRGWITVFPNSGTTLSEIDYINIKVDTSSLAPGYYGDQIVFKSNAGEEIAEVFIDVISDTGHKVTDVFLYSKDFDYLFTSDPQAESRRLIQNGYIKEGIAFRLFAANTPGTTFFYRWYNPILKDHYYHYDRTGGGKKLDGYVYEGIIGNIATSRMTNTRELYRWRNPTTGKHYYSTNPKGANGMRKGYRFEGIAGYVR